MSTHNLVKSLRADRSQLASEVRQLRAEVERAKRALLAHGFTDCGGAEWKPPLGPHPGTLLAEVERLRALDKEAKSAFAPWVQGPGIVGGILHLQEEVERLRAEANARAVEELQSQVRVWSELKDRPGVSEDRRDLYARLVAVTNGRIAELSKPAAAKDDTAKCWSCGGQGYIGTTSGIPGMIGYAHNSCSRCGGTGKLHYVAMEQLKDGEPEKPVTGPNYLDQEEFGHTKSFTVPLKKLAHDDGGSKPEEPDWTVAMEEKAEQIREDNEDEASTATVRLLFQVVKALCNLGREVRRGGKS